MTATGYGSGHADIVTSIPSRVEASLMEARSARVSRKRVGIAVLIAILIGYIAFYVLAFPRNNFMDYATIRLFPHRWEFTLWYPLYRLEASMRSGRFSYDIADEMRPEDIPDASRRVWP
jgi:hypothetical protein